MIMLHEPIAQEVLRRYSIGPWIDVRLTLHDRPGFSGAVLWHISSPLGELCLRAWPPDGPSPANLQEIHLLMMTARAGGLAYVPALQIADHGKTWLEHAGRLWELTTWMPGKADFQARPSHQRLAAACTALSELHRIWEKVDRGTSVCPAILRRFERLRAWQDLVCSGWRPALVDLDPLTPWAEKAWRLVQHHRVRLPALLTPWLGVKVPVQPCLCDLWHDHVFYQGEKVSALVDYGSVKRDHVAADLARLLGSLVSDDATMQATGIEAYRQVRSLSEADESLVRILDKTGTVLGTANWLRWIYHEEKEYGNRAAVARRLATLVERMEKWA
jgi:Ser/Thr protein kinase RdoA (MazF antagonist)